MCPTLVRMKMGKIPHTVAPLPINNLAILIDIDCILIHDPKSQMWLLNGLSWHFIENNEAGKRSGRREGLAGKDGLILCLSARWSLPLHPFLLLWVRACSCVCKENVHVIYQMSHLVCTCTILRGTAVLSLWSLSQHINLQRLGWN